MNEKFILAQAEYMDIILSLLGKRYGVNSLFKLVVLSFYIRRGSLKGLNKSLKKDSVERFFCNLIGNMEKNINDLCFILRVIDVLSMTGVIRVDGDVLIVDQEINYSPVNDVLRNVSLLENNVIDEINRFPSTAFMRELLRNV